MKKKNEEAALAVQWLRLYTSSAGGLGSISGWKTKIQHAVWSSQKKIMYSYDHTRECYIHKNMHGKDT